jgi:hypothetical protein
MAFHVEISSDANHARVFNLSPEVLRAQVLVPFLAGDDVELGDRTWRPAECELIVLEGPTLANDQLAYGRGWGTANRNGRDVTLAALDTVRQSLVPAGIAILASERQDESYVGAALQRLGHEAIEWSLVRDRLVTGETDDVVVVLALGDTEPDPEWWFGAGLAAGALSRRTILVVTGTQAIPAALERLPTLRLDEGDEPFAAALARTGAAAVAG